MRSDLIFGALAHVKNRYQLCQLASKATRMLHKPNTRLQDTTNDVLSASTRRALWPNPALQPKSSPSSSAAQHKARLCFNPSFPESQIPENQGS